MFLLLSIPFFIQVKLYLVKIEKLFLFIYLYKSVKVRLLLLQKLLSIDFKKCFNLTSFFLEKYEISNYKTNQVAIMKTYIYFVFFKSLGKLSFLQ